MLPFACKVTNAVSRNEDFYIEFYYQSLSGNPYIFYSISEGYTLTETRADREVIKLSVTAASGTTLSLHFPSNTPSLLIHVLHYCVKVIYPSPVNGGYLTFIYLNLSWAVTGVLSGSSAAAVLSRYLPSER